MDKIPYLNPVTVDNQTYSIDKVKLSVVLPDELVDNILSDYRYLSEMIPGITLKEPEEHSYRYRFPCEKSYYDSFGNKVATVSMKFINNSEERLKCGIIEFNPNKCHEHEHIIDEVRTILSLTESYHFESLDFAIDIPINKMLVHLLKDKRAQLIYKASKDCSTEYLGKKRNDPGHVKLYNKSRESGLSTPWTRIEITVGDPSLPDWGQKLYDNWLPKVTFFDPKGLIPQDIQLNDTEKVLLELLQYNPEKAVHWNRLGRKEKAKLKPLVFADQKYLEYNFDAINQVVHGMVSLMDPYVISANSNSSINSSNGSSEA